MSELTRKEEQILLAIHSLQKDASLTNIRERIRKYTGKNYSVGTIYAPLNRLHLNGLLDSTLKKTKDSKKPVRYYKVTQEGFQALAKLKDQTETMWNGFVSPAPEKQR